MSKMKYLEEIEVFYQQVKSVFVSDAGQEAFDAIERDLKLKNELNINVYGYNSTEYLTSADAVTKEDSFRQFKSYRNSFSPEDQLLYDSIYSMTKDISDEYNQINYKRKLMNALTDYYYRSSDDYRIPNATRKKAEETAAKQQSLTLELDAYLTKLGTVQLYTSHLLETMLGVTDLEALNKDRNLNKTRAEYDAFVSNHQYSISDETKYLSKTETLEERVKNTKKPIQTETSIDIQAKDPNFGVEFIQWAANMESKKLTDTQRLTACQNFDILVGFHFKEKELKKMKEQGIDVFDHIYVDGKSLNERYEEKYASSSYFRAAEMMKCEFLADAINGKEIHIVKDENIIPVRFESDLDGLSELTTFSKSLELHTPASLSEKVKQDRERLAARSEKEIVDKKVRMALDRPPIDFSVVEIQKSSIIEYKPQFIKQAKHEQFKKLYVKEGTVESKHTMEQAADEMDFLLLQFDCATQNPLHSLAGMKGPAEFFYVDGVPVLDYVKKLHPDRDLNPNDTLVKAELFTAIINGNHHIEFADLGTDEIGNYQIGVKQLKYDISDFDSETKIFRTKPSVKQEKLFANDTQKDARHDLIRNHFSQKIAANINHMINQKEKETYEKAVQSITEKAKDTIKPATMTEAISFTRLLNETEKRQSVKIDKPAEKSTKVSKEHVQQNPQRVKGPKN